MIEAMACGTPVIAWNNGSVSEVIEHGVSGFIVESEEEAAMAVRKASHIDRREVRRVFERRFSATAMARKYMEVYRNLLHRRTAVTRLEGAELYGTDACGS
jgi:glycosyltransferase involved in cell wall biosynthesis